MNAILRERIIVPEGVLIETQDQSDTHPTRWGESRIERFSATPRPFPHGSSAFGVRQ
jgi:hypothetical protein